MRDKPRTISVDPHLAAALAVANERDTLKTQLAEALRLLQRINRLTRHPRYEEQPMLPLFAQLVGSETEALLARMNASVR
jgi:hypothetical protein